MKVSNIIQKTSLIMRRKLIENRIRGIYYVVPDVGWSTDWDGHYISRNVSEQFTVKIELTSDPRWLAGHVIHFGSLWEFLGYLDTRYDHHNRIVTTVFHGDKEGKNQRLRKSLELLLANQKRISLLVTSNETMKLRFEGWGFPKEKIVCIPLGVDLSVFKPLNTADRRLIRNEFDIPEKALCIGSFHKDGKGWEEGLEPKLSKGPDVFLDSLREVKKSRDDFFVLLSAPARGYVKKGLDQMDIPYRHIVVNDYRKLAYLYAALDVYLVSSREEGGPKGPLEAMASGIPVVSTRVGLVPDVISHGENGLLAEIEDTVTLSRHLLTLLENRRLGKQLAAKGLKTIQAYDWSLIAERYYRDVYAPLLKLSRL